MNQEVEQIKRHVDEAMQGLRGEMAAEFTQVRGEISEFRRDAAEVADHLLQEVVETRKNAGAQAEELRSEIRAVAEGVALANERINDVDLRVDSLTGRVDPLTGHVNSLTGSVDTLTGSVDTLTGRADDLSGRLDGLTSEVRRGFAGVRAQIHRLHETDDELRRRIEAQEQRGA